MSDDVFYEVFHDPSGNMCGEFDAFDEVMTMLRHYPDSMRNFSVLRCRDHGEDCELVEVVDDV